MDHIINNFQITGKPERYFPYGNGHINDTYKVETGNYPARNYLLQRINHRVFKNVPELMDNIRKVTTHIRKKLLEIPGTDPEREGLTLIDTLEGKSFLQDDQGNYYRMFLYIEDHNTYDIVQSAHQVHEAGRIFGKFQKLISDLPGDSLHETIRDFHNIQYRLDCLSEACRSDNCGRTGYVGEELDFVEERADEMKILLELSRKGSLPIRVTHNDTKLNNVLFDKNDKGLCVIDLDTVMPGLVHYDFGDAIRTSTNTGAEDEADLDRVEMNPGFFEAYTRGFLKEMTGLTETELAYLPMAAKLFPYIIGIRFLTDYLDGDKYFKIKHSEHNLQRTRAQFKLMRSMERQYDRMKEIVSKVSGEYAYQNAGK